MIAFITMKKKEVLLAVVATLLLAIAPLVNGVTVQPVLAQKIECISLERNETSVVGPSPSPNVIPPETSPPSEEGIGSVQELEKLTGNNRAIILNNTDITNPKLTISRGVERAQLGDIIPAEQGTILEGEIMKNITNICWQQ